MNKNWSTVHVYYVNVKIYMQEQKFADISCLCRQLIHYSWHSQTFQHIGTLIFKPFLQPFVYLKEHPKYDYFTNYIVHVLTKAFFGFLPTNCNYFFLPILIILLLLMLHMYYCTYLFRTISCVLLYEIYFLCCFSMKCFYWYINF